MQTVSRRRGVAQKTTPLDVALMVAGIGVPIVPLADRVPLIANPRGNASTDEQQIRFWWRLFPSASVGFLVWDDDGAVRIKGIRLLTRPAPGGLN